MLLIITFPCIISFIISIFILFIIIINIPYIFITWKTIVFVIYNNSEYNPRNGNNSYILDIFNAFLFINQYLNLLCWIIYFYQYNMIKDIHIQYIFLYLYIKIKINLLLSNQLRFSFYIYTILKLFLLLIMPNSITIKLNHLLI